MFLQTKSKQWLGNAFCLSVGLACSAAPALALEKPLPFSKEANEKHAASFQTPSDKKNKKLVSPTVANENKPTALGGGMYLMKEGGLWGSLMQLPRPQPAPGRQQRPSNARTAHLSAHQDKPETSGKPSLCVASDQNQILILRADAKGLEVRSVNKQWHLKKGQQTKLKITAGKFKEDLLMTALDDNQMGDLVTLEQMAFLVEALSQNEEAVLTYKRKLPESEKKTKTEIRHVSLKLATPVFDNFRECVRFSGFLHLKRQGFGTPSQHGKKGKVSS